MKKYNEKELKGRITALWNARIYFVQKIEDLSRPVTNRDLLNQLYNQLYEIADCLEMALKDIERGRYTYPKAMGLVERQLESLIKSPEYRDFSARGELEYFRNRTGIISIDHTRHHLKVMFQVLDEITD